MGSLAKARAIATRCF
ncbi:hypothetical protein VCHC17A1_1148A, partial [Vibrio cholerae HC-17A1]